MMVIPRVEYDDSYLSAGSMDERFTWRWFLSEFGIRCEIWKNKWWDEKKTTSEAWFVKSIHIQKGAERTTPSVRFTEELMFVGPKLKPFRFYWAIDAWSYQDCLDASETNKNPIRPVLMEADDGS